jgi:hypothetical protein
MRHVTVAASSFGWVFKNSSMCAFSTLFVFLVGVVMVKHNRETKLGGLLGQVRLF